MSKKTIKGVLTAFVMFVLTANTAFASEKDIPVTLNKKYDACAFTISTEKPGTFDITLRDPHKKEYTGSIEGGTETEILVKDVDSGEWTVHVETRKEEPVQVVEEGSEDSSEEGTEETTEGEEAETIEPTAEQEIGKVKVSVRAIDVSSYTIDDDIKVAKDIVGLKMYFKDDNIEVEWSDSSAGNVVVTVTDTQTNVELGKETVNGNSYECAIPVGTKQITVSVVPATSASVEGAKNQYTLDFVNNPDATVNYENKEYVNTDTIPVNVELRQGYAVEFVVNGKVIEDVPKKEAGTYDYEVPVSEGSNEVLTYIIDDDGNMRSTAYNVIRDSIRPNLTLDYEYNGKSTYETNVKFTGSVSDYSGFTINGSDVKVSGDGTFSHEYELHDGANSIVFKAVDLAGNETIYDATVTKLVKEKKEIPWIPIISGVIVLVGLIIYFIRKKNDPGNGRYNNLIDGIKEKVSKNNTQKNASAPKGKLNAWQRALIELAVVALVSFVMFKAVLVPGYVPSSSMEPTLMTGDWGFANGLAYVFHEPQRGDIVVFKSAELNEILIKRIVGLPGDTVSFYDGYVYINDGLVYEEYIGKDVETNSNVQDFIVPDGCYFVLGDNRENSFDSRYWDNPYVAKKSIIGKYMFTILHTGNKTEITE